MFLNAFTIALLNNFKRRRAEVAVPNEAFSQQIRHIFHDYTPLVEPLSLDEAYLDVSASDRYAWDIAKEIRARIFAETALTASAGIASNKMLAKIASDWRKPNGQFAILPDQVQKFMEGLPVRKIWGIGPKSAERFASRGILTCSDLQKIPLPEMVALVPPVFLIVSV